MKLIEIDWNSKLSYHFRLGSHAVPQWFDPFPAQDSENHHERMKEIGKIPPENDKYSVIGFPLFCKKS